MVEIRGTRAVAATLFILGVVMTLLGGVITTDNHGATVPGLAMLALGAVISLGSLRRLLSRAPLLRATHEGIAFAGGRPVPWSAIKQIYVGRMNVNVNGISARTQSIAIDFHKKRTLFRLPVSFWISHPVAVGDLDIGATGRADVTASKLEAMRVTASGTEDGATIGGSELPAARVVERDR